VRTLAPGSYTAVMHGANGSTGVGLVEVYDLTPNSVSLLANISSRGLVETGENVMIGGFIVGPVDHGSPEVVVRAIGPSLASSGVANTLQDPVLELHDQSGTILATNDNWLTDRNSSFVLAAGLAPSDTRESALAITLTPGNYTAIVRGANDTVGVALVEVYNLQ
jgi:hypothetical protein